MSLSSRLKNLESEVAAPGDGLAAALAAGAGADAVYDHTTDVGTKTLLAADASNDRVVLIIATVTEAFAGTTKPLMKIGETSTVTKFGQIGEGQLAGTPIGKTYVFSGTLLATKALLVTITDGSGGTPAGKLSVVALVFPVAS